MGVGTDYVRRYFISRLLAYVISQHMPRMRCNWQLAEDIYYGTVCFVCCCSSDCSNSVEFLLIVTYFASPSENDADEEDEDSSYVESCAVRVAVLAAGAIGTDAADLLLPAVPRVPVRSPAPEPG